MIYLFKELQAVSSFHFLNDKELCILSSCNSSACPSQERGRVYLYNQSLA